MPVSQSASKPDLGHASLSIFIIIPSFIHSIPRQHRRLEPGMSHLRCHQSHIRCLPLCLCLCMYDTRRRADGGGGPPPRS